MAIAGHDADTFVRYPAEGTPTLAIQRNARHASWIDLPLKSRGDLGPLPETLPTTQLYTTALCPTASVLCVALPLACWRCRRRRS